MPPVETLRPNDAGDLTTLAISGDSPAATNWESVDEETPDDNTTYVYCTSPDVGTSDLYNLPAHSEGSGTINSVKVYIRCKENVEGYGYPLLKSNSTITTGTLISLTSDWVTYSQTWTTNPADSETWEWADIDALQIGVVVKAGQGGGGRTGYCTQVYVEVDYTQVVTAEIAIGTAVSASRAYGRVRTAALTIGTAVAASRVLTFNRTASLTIGSAISAFRGFAKTALITIGQTINAFRGFGKTATITIGTAMAASRTITFGRVTSLTIGGAITASRRWAAGVTSTITIGVAVSAIRVWGAIRAASITIGQAITATTVWYKIIALTLQDRSAALTLRVRSIVLNLLGRHSE